MIMCGVMRRATWITTDNYWELQLCKSHQSHHSTVTLSNRHGSFPCRTLICSRTLYIKVESHRLLIMVGLISLFAQNDSKIQRGLLLHPIVLLLHSQVGSKGPLIFIIFQGCLFLLSYTLYILYLTGNIQNV